MKKHWVNPNCQNSEPTKRTVSISAIVRFHEILFQTASASFSFLSWKTKKFYSLKKYFLRRGWLEFFYLARYVTANNRKNYRNKPQCANPCNSEHEGLLLLQYLFLSLQLSDWKKETAPILRWFFMKKRKRHFLTFPACFSIPIIFSNLNYNCSTSLDLRNLQEQVKKAFCYQKMFWPFTVFINCSRDLKIFANSQPSALNFKSFSKSLEQFCVTKVQNNFGNKIHTKIFVLLLFS